MKTQTKIILTSISMSIFLTACSSTQPKIASIDEETKKELKLEAMSAIKTVGGAFQKSLMSKIKEGGLTNAATFCSTNAVHLEKEVSKLLKDGVSVKRVTNKPRNSKNKANEQEKLVLEELKMKLAIGEKVDMLVKQKSANHYQVYKPIVMAGKCLNCHGDESKRNAQAYNIISKKYANDKAINYKLGDFRGAFLVDIIK